MRETLAGGKPGHIEPEVAEGPIAQLLSRVADRNRKDFLGKWVSHEKDQNPGGPHLRHRPRRAFRSAAHI